MVESKGKKKPGPPMPIDEALFGPTRECPESVLGSVLCDNFNSKNHSTDDDVSISTRSSQRQHTVDDIQSLSKPDQIEEYKEKQQQALLGIDDFDQGRWGSTASPPDSGDKKVPTRPAKKNKRLKSNASSSSSLLRSSPPHTVSLQELRRIASQGIVDKGSYRPVAWRVLLGYLPPDTSQWKEQVLKERMLYRALVGELFVEPKHDGDDLRGHHPKRAEAAKAAHARKHRNRDQDDDDSESSSSFSSSDGESGFDFDKEPGPEISRLSRGHIPRPKAKAKPILVEEELPDDAPPDLSGAHGMDPSKHCVRRRTIEDGKKFSLSTKNPSRHSRHSRHNRHVRRDSIGGDSNFMDPSMLATDVNSLVRSHSNDGLDRMTKNNDSTNSSNGSSHNKNLSVSERTRQLLEKELTNHSERTRNFLDTIGMDHLTIHDGYEESQQRLTRTADDWYSKNRIDEEKEADGSMSPTKAGRKQPIEGQLQDEKEEEPVPVHDPPIVDGFADLVPARIKEEWKRNGRDHTQLVGMGGTKGDRSCGQGRNAMNKLLVVDNRGVTPDGSRKERVTVNDDPLSTDSDSKWFQFFENASMLDEIRKDVVRTHPDLYFFLEPENNLGQRRYAAIERILFVWAKLNKGVRYVQGMNEIVGTIYYVLANDFNEEWACEAEADTYFLFNTLMVEMRDVFVPDLDEADTGIQGRISNIMSLLSLHDPEVRCHLDDCGIDGGFYGIRWLTTLLSREFLLPDTIRLWDSMFASTHKDNFLRYVCVTMVMIVRDELLRGDFSTCLRLLQQYPPTNIDDLLESSRALWIYESQITLACHKGGISLQKALTSIAPPPAIIMAYGLPGGVAVAPADRIIQAGERGAANAGTKVSSSGKGFLFGAKGLLGDFANGLRSRSSGSNSSFASK
mmetsp:Transcript_5352/g.7575  ORF Transcript_5352/g.7575 Transcript_5352/m.7575 type:complete len:903 (+) Transcript_5352:437-3145(+)